MRLACSPFARPPRLRLLLLRLPHTNNPTAPEMTIGASTRVEPRGSLPRGVPKPRPPNPIHGRSARPLVAPPRAVNEQTNECNALRPPPRCVAPKVGSHYRARPNSAGRGHSAARDHRQPPPPVAPRPCPQDRKTARERERYGAKEKDAHFYTLPRPPASRPPRAAGSASGAQETPPSRPTPVVGVFVLLALGGFVFADILLHRYCLVAKVYCRRLFRCWSGGFSGARLAVTRCR